MPKLSRFTFLSLFSASLLALQIPAYSQEFTEDSVAKESEQVYQVLAAEIALQRGEVAAAYQTYMVLAKSSRDPRAAQRAVEIAIAVSSPASSLEAARLWNELSPANDQRAKEVLITLLMLNNQWLETVDPTVAFLKTLKPSEREQFLIQTAPLVSKAADEDIAIRSFSKIIGALIPLPQNSDILFLYAMGEEKEKNFANMERILKILIKKNPKDKNALNALGYSLADRNVRLKEAFQFISKAHDLAPDDGFILDSLGWVNFRLGNLDVAEAQLLKAFEMKSEADIGAHLGEVLWTQGHHKEADEIWKKAELLDANNTALTDTLRRLRPDWSIPEAFDQTIKRHWDGRFAVKINGKKSQDGGSGSFTLDHDALNDILEIRSPVGSAIARINIGPASATIEQGGEITEAVDADALIEKALGMPIPARGLSAWLSGFIRPGSPGKLERDASGKVSKILQDGWLLTYTWSDKQLEKLILTRVSEAGEVDIRLIFDRIDE